MTAKEHSIENVQHVATRHAREILRGDRKLVAKHGQRDRKTHSHLVASGTLKVQTLRISSHLKTTPGIRLSHTTANEVENPLSSTAASGPLEQRI